MTALEAVFSWVLTTTWQASVLAVLVLATQWLFGARLNPRWRYALWLLVLLRLVLPDLPESALSLFRIAPAAPLNLPETIPTPEITVSVAASALSMPHALALPHQNYTFLILAIVWLSGALGLLVLTALVNRRFARHVTRAPQITDESLRKIFAEAKAELGIRRHIRLVESGRVRSPAIMGLFTPTLLLPDDAREKFTPRELRFIFLHELAHLKRGDVFVQALIALLQIIHWFNPVLWYAFRRLRADREPATDALVLSRTGEADKEPYGLMLLKLLEHFNQRHALPTLVGILQDKDQFKRRFSLIAKFTRGSYGWSLLGILLIATLAAVCLTKAKTETSTAHTNAVPAKKGAPVRLQFLALHAPDGAFTGANAAESALKIYEQNEEKHENGDVETYGHDGKNTPRLVGHAALHTRMGQGAGWGSGPGFICLEAEGTPRPRGAQISVTGTLTIDSQNWSGVEPTRTLTLNAVPHAVYPINLDVESHQLRALQPEGILEPDAARPGHDKTPRRLFVYLSAWPESEADAAADSATPAPDSATPAPSTVSAPTPPTSDTAAQNKIIQKLQTLVFDHIDFEHQDILDVIQQLTQKSKEVDPEKEGVSFVVRLDSGSPSAPDPEIHRDITLHLHNATLAEVLGNIVQQTKLTYAFEEYAIYLRPPSVDQNTRVVRTFRVPANFLSVTLPGPGDTASADGKTRTVTNRLMLLGFKFSSGAVANYCPGSSMLVVSNTPEQLDLIAEYLKRLSPANAADHAPAPSTSNASKVGVQIGLKLLSIDDHFYHANKARMDTAVERGDVAYFVNLEHVSMLSTPSVTTRPGNKANIEIVREFPYPTQFEPSKLVPNQKVGTQTLTLMVPPTPREFVTRDVGVSAEITPTINDATTLAPGKIVLLGKVSVCDFEGFAKSNVQGVAGMPSFNTSESNFLEQLGDGEQKGVWIPGLHAEEPPAPDKNAPPYASTSPGTSVKRMLLFVSATRVP